MKSIYKMIATLCRRIKNWCREYTKIIADAVIVKIREYMVKLIALFLLSAVIIITINIIPTQWQSRLVVTLKKVGFPEWLVPNDPKGFTYSVEIGEAGFGYVTNLFQGAGTDVNEIIHYDATKMPHVLVGHRWRYAGKNVTDALKAFIKQHPNCFSVKIRPGGGLEVEPLDIQGDFLYGSDKRIIAFACECRSNLEEVRLQFLRDQGLSQTDSNKANSANAKIRVAD